jgi:hypothetical protein
LSGIGTSKRFAIGRLPPPNANAMLTGPGKV